jgi:hypothetical protein
MKQTYVKIMMIVKLLLAMNYDTKSREAQNIEM